MAFLIYPLADFMRDCKVRDQSNRDITVLQNPFPVNLNAEMRIENANTAAFSLPASGALSREFPDYFV
jgi:hypothetical protein